MITPKSHVRNWLHNHNTSAVELSGMVRKSPVYVASFLAPSGGKPAAILVLHKVVDFPPELIRAANLKQALMNKRKRRAINRKAQKLFDQGMRAWKAPKELCE